MNRRRQGLPIAGAAAIIALLALTGAAPPPAAPRPAAEAVAAPDLIGALVVKARTPGPAWWKVSKGDSVVWVLGAPDAIPAALKWNQKPLETRLKGANTLIMPAREKIGLVDILKLIFTLRGEINGKDRIEQRLPPELLARYQAARARGSRGPGPGPQLGGDQDGDPKTVILAWILQANFERPLHLNDHEPETAAQRIALRLKVHTETVGTYDQMPIIREFLSMPEPLQETCLEREIGKIEAGERVRQNLANAWARGDVPAALARLPGEAFCATGPLAAAQDQRVISDTVVSIGKALDRKGGKAVAIVEFTPLVSEGGVLARLQAQGYKVETPDLF